MYGKDTLAERVNGTAPQLADALQKIHTKAPGAKVLVVGYPSVLPDNEWNCLGRQPVTVGDVAYLRTVLGRLNKMLADTAAANAATYVDTQTPSKGHDVCSDDRWVEGALPGSPAAPFHLNATGERARPQPSRQPCSKGRSDGGRSRARQAPGATALLGSRRRETEPTHAAFNAHRHRPRPRRDGEGGEARPPLRGGGPSRSATRQERRRGGGAFRSGRPAHARG
ncbi:GDSL-type esterase/lipase family protein [Streptomyces violascens]|uniref:GDSL-type esterase/lipase family protein n=1 Tax=Streptomyces violascens TaxID=67381 RepID=UPI003664F6CC